MVTQKRSYWLTLLYLRGLHCTEVFKMRVQRYKPSTLSRMNFLGIAARVPLAPVSHNRIRGVKWKGNVSYRSRPLIAMSVEAMRTCLYQVGNLFLNELIVATKEFRNYKR